MPFRRTRKKDEDKEVEANLIPVLSCLFLLIPALLLAMEIAPFTAVRVESPRFSSLAPDPEPPHGEPELRLKVHVREDGFVTQFGAAYTVSSKDHTIPMNDAGLHDFAALENHARELKVKYPHEALVTLSAESSVEYGTLVRSMDALRGQQCSLRGVFSGEAPPEDCYFWQVVVQSG